MGPGISANPAGAAFGNTGVVAFEAADTHGGLGGGSFRTFFGMVTSTCSSTGAFLEGAMPATHQLCSDVDEY